MLQILPPMEEGQSVAVDGFLVPRVKVTENKATGLWYLTLDERFGVSDVPIEELNRWLWIIANAQAIGAGYSCHGENSIERNPYKTRVACIGEVSVPGSAS
nr:hypothetical protein [Delftia acidovorans]